MRRRRTTREVLDSAGININALMDMIISVNWYQWWNCSKKNLFPSQTHRSRQVRRSRKPSSSACSTLSCPPLTSTRTLPWLSTSWSGAGGIHTVINYTEESTLDIEITWTVTTTTACQPQMWRTRPTTAGRQWCSCPSSSTTSSVGMSGRSQVLPRNCSIQNKEYCPPDY